MPYICLRIQTSKNFQHNTLEEEKVPYGMKTTVSSSASAVTEVFRTPHFQEHKVSGMLSPTPLQLHLNLVMPLQNYMTYSLFLLPIFGELPSYIFVHHANGHDTGYERFLQNCISCK